MKILDLTNDDFNSLYDFMQPLWFDTYSAIIPKRQIEFLLDKYFSKSAIENFRKQGYEYKKIDNFGVVIFVERDNDIFLDKLYISPSHRGKGIPEKIFEYLLNRGKDITLNVNQGNERAVKCYLKNGFTIEVVHDVLLGDGMVNKDYVMRKRAK